MKKNEIIRRLTDKLKGDAQGEKLRETRAYNGGLRFGLALIDQLDEPVVGEGVDDWKTAYELKKAACAGFADMYEKLFKKYQNLQDECEGLYIGTEQLRFELGRTPAPAMGKESVDEAKLHNALVKEYPELVGQTPKVMADKIRDVVRHYILQPTPNAEVVTAALVKVRFGMLAVLCDPEGEPCFAGSDGDRAIIKHALATIDAALAALHHPKPPEKE